MAASKDLIGIGPDEGLRVTSRRASNASRVESRAEDADTRVNLAEFFHVLRRRIGLIILSVLVALALAVAYVLLASPVYTATTSIIIDPRERPPIGSDQVLPPQNPDMIMTETQVKLITSETVLRRVVDKLNLLDDPDFGKPGLIGRLLVMLRGEPPAAEREKRIQGLITTLTDVAAVRRSERTYLFELDVRAKSAEKAAVLANAIAQAYIDDQTEVNDDYLRRQAKFVNERLIDLQTKVQEAENRAQDYRARNGIVNSSGVLVNEQQLTEAAKQLATAHARTADARSRYDQVKRLTAAGRTTGGLPEALKSTLVEKLRVQVADLLRQEANLKVTFGDRHPALIEVREQIRSAQTQLDLELRRVADGTYNELQAALASEAEVTRQVADLKKATTTTNGSLVALRELDREVEANRGVYERFLRARESLRKDIGDPLMARIASPAVPPLNRTSPRTLGALITALAGGLAVGMALALGSEHRARFGSAPVSPPPRGRRTIVTEAAEPSIMSPSSDPALASRIEKVVSAPTPSNDKGTPAASDAAPSAAREAVVDKTHVDGEALLVLPHLAPRPDITGRPSSWGNRIDRLLEVRDHGSSAYSRAIHDFCAEILDDCSGDEVVKILITSIESGTGKSVLAANLAQAAAEAGERVLLIDANSAHPTLVGLVPPSDPPSLIDLNGTIRLVHKLWEGAGSLHLIPLSPAEKRLTRRLMRDGAADHFDGIAGNFDLVIVDGPVAGLEDESLALAAATDEIIMVEGAGTTMAEVQPVLRSLRAQGKFRGLVRIDRQDAAQVA